MTTARSVALIPTVLIAAVGLLMMACGAETGPDELPPPELLQITTDSASYTAVYREGIPPFDTYDFRVITRFTNHSSITVYLGRCYPNTLEPIYGLDMADGDSVSAYNPSWLCVQHDDQFVIGPEQTRTDTIRVVGPARHSIGGAPIGFLSGPMRIAFVVQACKGAQRCIIPSAGLSGVFNVVVHRVGSAAGKGPVR